MKDESIVSQEVQIKARYYDCNLLRNNSGACIDEEGRLIRFGLGNISKKHSDAIKSSDLIGITKVTITPDMVGQTVGIFTAVEVKKEAWNPDKKLDGRESAQLAFINWIRSLGGIAFFASSVDDVDKNLLR